MPDEMKVSLPEGVVKPIIEAQVVEALKGSDQLIEQMVRFIMTQKVRDQSTYKDYPFLEFTCREAIRDAVTDGVRQWVSDKAPAIRKEVEKQMRGQIRGIASKLVTALVDQAGDRFRLEIAVKVPERY